MLWSPNICSERTTFASTSAKPIRNDSGQCRLEIKLYWDLKFHGHYTFYFLDINQVVLGQVQRPITYFRGARDDFMVHDVNNPWDYLIMEFWWSSTLMEIHLDLVNKFGSMVW